MNYYTFENSSDLAAASAAAAVPPAPSTRGALPNGVTSVPRGDIRLCLPDTLPNDIPIRRTTKSCFEGYRVLESIGAGTYAHVWKVARTGISKAVRDDSGHGGFQREPLPLQKAASSRGTECEMLVRHGTHAEEPEVFAAKLLQPQKFSKDTLPQVVDMFTKEIVNLAHCQCPGVVRVEEIVEGAEGWLVVQEYLDGGTLWCDQVCRDEDDAFLHFIQLVQAVLLLQEKNIVHRDLKPTNVLRCRKNKRVLLADFGWSERVDRCQHSQVEWPGTLEINPPEVINCTGPLTERIDNYALGMALMFFLSGRFICRQKGFDATSAAPFVLRTVHQVRSSGPPANFHGPPEAWTLFLGLTAPDPSRRWSLNRVLSHSWVQQKLVQLAPRAHLWHPRVCRLMFQLTRVFADRPACSGPSRNSYVEQEGGATTPRCSENEFAYGNACMRNSCNGIYSVGGTVEVGGNQRVRATECAFCPPCGIAGCTGRPCLKFFMQNRVVSQNDYNKLQTSLEAEAHPAADRPRTSVRSTAGSLPTPYEIMLSTDEWKAATLRRRFSAPTLQAFHPFMRFVARPPPGLAGPQHQATGDGNRASNQRSANQASDVEYVTPPQTGDSNCAEAKENLRFSVSYAGAAGQSRGASDCKTNRRSTLPGDAWDLLEQRMEFVGHRKAFQQDQNSFQQHENALSQQQQKRQLQHSHQRQQLTPQCPRSRAGAHGVHHYLRQPQDNPSLRGGWEEKMRSERQTHALGEMGEAPGPRPPQSRRVPSSPSDGRLTQSPVAGGAAALPENWHQKMHGKFQQYRRGGSHGGTPLQFVTETHAETREQQIQESAMRAVALLQYRQALCRRMEVNLDTSSGCESRREERAALNANGEYARGIRGQRPCQATLTGAEGPQESTQSSQHAERESSASLPPSLHSTDKAFANGYPRGDASPPPSLRRSSAGPPISESPRSQGSVLTQLAPSGACDTSVRPGGTSRAVSREEGRLIRTAAQRCLPSRLSFESPLADEPTGPKRTDPPAAGVPLMSNTSFHARAGRDTDSRGALSHQKRAGEAACGFVERGPTPQVGGTSVDASLKNVQGGGYGRVKTFAPPFFFGDKQVPFFQSQRMPQQMTAAYATPRALRNGTLGESGWWRTGAPRQFTLGKTTPRPDPPCEGWSPKLPRTLSGGCVSRDSAGSEGCAESGSHRLNRLPGQALGEPRSAGDPPSDVTVGKDCCLHETPREKTEGFSQGTTHGHMQTIVYGNTGAFVGDETGSPRDAARRVSFSGCSPRGPPGGDNSRPQGGEAEKKGKALSPASASGYGRSSTGAGGGGVADAETVGRLDARHLRELQHDANFDYGGNAKNGNVSPSGNTHYKGTTRGSDPDLAEAAAMMNRDSQGTMAIAGTLTFGGVSPKRNSDGGTPPPTGVHNPSEAAQRKVPGYGETTTTSVLRLVHRSPLPMYSEAILPDGRSPRGAGCSSAMSSEAKDSVDSAHSQEEPWIACLMRNCRGLVQQQMPSPAATETQEVQSQCRLQNDVADTSQKLHEDWTGDRRGAGGSGKSGLRTQVVSAKLELREVQGGGVQESCILQRDLHAFRERLLQARSQAFHESPHTRGIYEQGAGESEADAASFLQRFVSHLLESGGDLQGRAVGPQSATKPLKAGVLPLASGLAPFDRRDDVLLMDYRGTGGASAVNAEIFDGDAGSVLRGPVHDELLLLSSSGGACLKTSPSEAQQLVQLIESTASAKRCTFEGLEVPSCAGATTTATTTGPGTLTLPATSPGAGEDGLDSGWGFQGLEGEDEPTAFRPESPVCTPIQ